LRASRKGRDCLAASRSGRPGSARAGQARGGDFGLARRSEQGTLRQRNRDNAHWFGKGQPNRANRNFYHRKTVWYREIARQYELNGGDIEAALNAVQAFADPYFRSGGGGWEAAEAALRVRTPADGSEATRLTGLYGSM